ncbi:hypothetical protein [Algicella marina]|uniref:Uncharacterized protein n=1 Tax=Algicella marina TaxID=2683284 RepID=A0A6P1T2M0_9RHOB|nr:hypothetical protein [Algicella marina]QHQ35971.1 hypothetical protein GO499_12720 [Algicella marina]
MTVIREARSDDLPAMAALLLAQADMRHARDPVFWPIAANAQATVTLALEKSLEGGEQPIWQRWLVAETDDRITGLAHVMRLPVPPIYAGRFGQPGLLREDSCVSPDADAGLRAELLAAAEEMLRADGAEVLLASVRSGEDWQSTCADAGYTPLTLYFAKSGLKEKPVAEGIRGAGEEDLQDIVARSAENRAILHRLNSFWEPHAEADARFGAWMQRSLSLEDRDMLIGGSGYIIAQPASPLHFPAAHEAGAVGAIDDFYHTDLADSTSLQNEGEAAIALLDAGESTLVARGRDAAFVVCPAAWVAKARMLEAAGYRPELIWMIKQ